MVKSIVELRKPVQSGQSDMGKVRALMPGDNVKFKILGKNPPFTFKLKVKGVTEIGEGIDSVPSAYLDADGFTFGDADDPLGYDLISMTGDCFISVEDGKNILGGTFIKNNGKKEILFETEYEITWEKI